MKLVLFFVLLSIFLEKKDSGGLIKDLAVLLSASVTWLPGRVSQSSQWTRRTLQAALVTSWVFREM